MKPSRWMVVACALAMMLGVVLTLAPPARAQQRGAAPEAEAPPPITRGRTSAEFISWQLGSAVGNLQHALTMQTNGTTPDPEQTSKKIYEGYVKVRSAHALLMRRMDKLQEPRPRFPTRSWETPTRSSRKPASACSTPGRRQPSPRPSGASAT